MKKTIKLDLSIILYSLLMGAVVGITQKYLGNKIDDRASFIVRFGEGNISSKEVLWTIPLIIIAILFSYIYKFYGMILKKILNPLKDKIIIKGIIGGLLIGIIGTYIPYTLFSGEHEIKELVKEWENISSYSLIIICLMKLLLTEICLNTGHKGGHIFPIIFSSACLGYGVSKILLIDPVFCLAIIISGFTSNATKNMFISIFILFFQTNMLIPIVLGSVVGKMVSDLGARY
ncbi:MAG: chloride channel protein [Peptostreptococcaceae bacterium]